MEYGQHLIFRLIQSPRKLPNADRMRGNFFADWRMGAAYPGKRRHPLLKDGFKWLSQGYPTSNPLEALKTPLNSTPVSRLESTLYSRFGPVMATYGHN